VVLNRRELLGRTNVVTEAANAQPAVHPRLLDRQLVTRCLAHDALAERALYDAHVERIYRLMHRMAGDADLAADFTQETFIRAFERLEQFRGDSSLATWLHTIAVSIALNGMRKVNRTQGRTEMIDDVPSLAAETFRFT
jgi:RNA polymerase sigma-70 factor (ECF subfamily)